MTGFKAVLAGTKDNGDTTRGMYIDADLTLNNASEVFRGLELDLTGMTLTSFDILAGVAVKANDGREVAIDTNYRGTISGRIEQGAPHFEDEFWAGVLKAQWSTSFVGNAGSVSATAGRANGWVTIATAGTAVNDAEYIDWNGGEGFVNSGRPTFEARVDLAAITEEKVWIGLYDQSAGLPAGGAQSYILFELDTSNDGNWHLVNDDAATGEQDLDTGEAATTSGVVLRFEFVSDTSVEVFINGTSQGTVSTAIPTAALEPLVYIETLNAGGGAKSLYADYVKVWQDRT